MESRSPANKSDLGVRVLSAIAMLAVAGAALWLGGWWWTIFVLIVAFGVWFEWSTLCLLMFPPGNKRTAWRYAGVVYCGIAVTMLMTLRGSLTGSFWVLVVVGIVIGTDVGAYCAGRLIGGPKIAPKISPSKTWAGLFGGMIGAALICAGLAVQLDSPGFIEFVDASDSMIAFERTFETEPRVLAFIGAVLAIVAQAGDFFESWMKRRAGVKDSGKLLPGHGGLFDRVDGLLSVLFVTGILYLAARLTGAW